MKIIVCEEGTGNRYVKEIAGTLQEMQQIVGGNIQSVLTRNGTVIVCNENMRDIKSAKASLLINGQLYIYGTCFICKLRGNELVSVSDEDIRILCEEKLTPEEEAIKHLEHFKMKYKFFKSMNDAKEDILNDKDCDIAIDAIRTLAGKKNETLKK